MLLPVLLWIDLRLQRAQYPVSPRLANQCVVHRVTGTAEIPAAIDRHAPRVLCFEYDHPDLFGLKALRQTRSRYPGLPVLMLTEYHSESLAVWALRTRVWDYLVKPVTDDDLLSRIDLLAQLSSVTMPDGVRHNVMPPSSVPIEARFCGRLSWRSDTHAAIAYVEARFHEKVTLGDVAGLCGMNATQFSRAFKRQHGQTFREFLLQYRIHKSFDLLKNPHVDVTDVALSVGFNDPSHFTRMFQRYAGVTPSRYRLKKAAYSFASVGLPQDGYTDRYMVAVVDVHKNPGSVQETPSAGYSAPVKK